NDVAVDLADQHHAGDVEGFRIGDPETIAELGLLAQPLHELADLRTAAVDDNRAHADGSHQHDVLRERVEIPDGVTPVLHHHDLVVEAADVRQSFGQDGGLGVGNHGHDVV